MDETYWSRWKRFAGSWRHGVKSLDRHAWVCCSNKSLEGQDMIFFSWWLNQPIWKSICQIGSFFPRFRVKNKIWNHQQVIFRWKGRFFCLHINKSNTQILTKWPLIAFVLSIKGPLQGANRDLHLGNQKVTWKKLASVCSQRKWNKNCVNRKIIWLWSLLPARGQREIILFQSTGTLFVFYCFLLVGAYKPPPYCNPLLVI